MRNTNHRMRTKAQVFCFFFPYPTFLLEFHAEQFNEAATRSAGGVRVIEKKEEPDNEPINVGRRMEGGGNTRVKGRISLKNYLEMKKRNKKTALVCWFFLFVLSKKALH